jgi:hypothetical protein
MNRYNVNAPKAKCQATTLYKINVPDALGERVVLATLQGLLANCSEEQLLFSTSSVELYDQYLENNYGVSIQTKINKKACSTWNLVSYFSDSISGYILCDESSSDESVSVAITLSGQLNAVVITKDLESKAKKAGLTCVLDVTGKNDEWLRSSEYWTNVNTQIAFEQDASMAPKLVDLAAMTGGYFSFYNGTNAAEHTEKYSFLEANALVYGYNNTLGEYKTVQSFSSLNVNMIPADHAYNLSVLSGFVKASAEQKREETSEISESTEEKNVHTVCLILSDGDNLQWLTNDFLTSSKWFGSSIRGSFCMGWGIPVTAIDTVSPFVDYLYDNMTTKDEFIAQLSGLGYTFPSKWKSSERKKMAEDVATYMSRTDLQYLEILDDGGFNTRTLSAFTAQDAIKGLFYIDYGNYAQYSGEILWSNNKPIVSAKYRLWAGLSDGSIENIAKNINRASTDPKSEDSYSFVIVHAWSGINSNKLESGGDTMKAVQKLIELFDSDVEVVTPTEFMNRIVRNLSN